MRENKQKYDLPDLTIETKLQGITIQMLDWWFENIDKGYALWHPEEHKLFEWEIRPGNKARWGAEYLVEDKVGKSERKSRHIRYIDPSISPITVDSNYVHAECELGENNEPVGWTIYEVKPDYQGILVRLKSISLGQIAQHTPDTHYKHIQEEMLRIPEFLPDMFKLWRDIPPDRPPLRIQPLVTKEKYIHPDPDTSLKKKRAKRNTIDTVVDDEIYGVTPDMIDWWTDNMEKGYPLWCPEDHYSNEWALTPGKVGHLNALKLEKERISEGPIITLYGRYADPSKMSDLQIIYQHISGGGLPEEDGLIHTYLSHQYEATSYGTQMRTILHNMDELPVPVEAFIKHDRAENGRFKDFLPQLYKMWQVVKDPMINVPCCLKYPYKNVNKREKQI